MISEKKLKKWRKEALNFNSILAPNGTQSLLSFYNELKEANTRIIKMTQELLDQHLLKK